MRERSDVLYRLGIAAVPIVVGLLVFLLYGAPTSYAIVNAVACVLGILALVFVRAPDSQNATMWIAGMALAVLAAPLLIGPEMSGISRWLALGPLTVNTGLVAVPVIAVACASGRSALLLVAAAAIVLLALQPDAAALLALALACIAIAPLRKDWRYALLGTTSLVTAALRHTDAILEPVPFV